MSSKKPSICMIGEGTVSDDIRLNLSGQILSRRGYRMIERSPYMRDGRVVIQTPMDICIFSRPRIPEAIREIKRIGAAKIIIDQDDDFWEIPTDHIGYNSVGPGNPKGLKLVEECLELADAVTTPSPVLADVLRKYTKAPIHILPNGWSKENPLWSIGRSSLAGDTVNIGWAGTITHRSDFKKCLVALTYILNKHKNTRIVIGQDIEIYKLFSKMPEKRKLFFPQLPYEFYPVIFSYIDIWLAPLVINKFNDSKSDIKLVDAGAAKKPWIASPSFAYTEWKDGGIIAKTQEEWIDALETYMISSNRERDGQVGWQKVQQREQEVITDAWEKIIKETL